MDAVDRVMQSYGHYCASARFFGDFYRHFLASPPQIRAKFATTDMVVQKHLPRAGVMNLVMYAHGISDSKLRVLGASHSRAVSDTHPELYDLWLGVLLVAVTEYDRDCGAETRDAWHDVMGRDTVVIKSYY